MIQLTLLKKKSSSLVYVKLEELQIPDVVSINELTPLMFAIGTMLTNYSETFSDPNIVNFLVDKSITTWTVADLESLQSNIISSNMELLVTFVDENTSVSGTGDTTYLVLNRSILELGFLPTETRFLVDANSVDLVSIFKSLVGEFNYYSASKFKTNPLVDLIDQLEESHKLLGIYDTYTLNLMLDKFDQLNKTIKVITLT